VEIIEQILFYVVAAVTIVINAALIILPIVIGIGAIIMSINTHFKKKRESIFYDKEIIELFERDELKRPWTYKAVHAYVIAYCHIFFFLDEEIVPAMGFKDIGELVHKYNRIFKQQWLNVQEKVLKFSKQNNKILKIVGFKNKITDDKTFFSLLQKISNFCNLETPIENSFPQWNEDTVKDMYMFIFFNRIASHISFERYCNPEKYTQEDGKDQLKYMQAKWGDEYYTKIKSVASEFGFIDRFDEKLLCWFFRYVYKIKHSNMLDWKFVAWAGWSNIFVETKSIILVTSDIIEFRVRYDYTSSGIYETLLEQKHNNKYYTDKWEKVSYVIAVCNINIKDKTFVIKDSSTWTYDGEELKSDFTHHELQKIPEVEIGEDAFFEHELSLTKVYNYVIDHWVYFAVS